MADQIIDLIMIAIIIELAALMVIGVLEWIGR